MAGNQIQSLSPEVVTKMRYVKKADFRMNDLTLPASEVARFTALEHLTHLDIRDNRIDELDIRVVKTLEYLNCERNAMYSLQVNGTALKNLLSAHNCKWRHLTQISFILKNINCTVSQQIVQCTLMNNSWHIDVD